MSANNAVVVILPGVVVAVGALVVFLVDLFVARKAVLAWIAAAGLIAGAAVAVGQWISVSNGLHFNRREPQTGFAGMVSLDKYTLFCVVLFAGIGVATIMLSDAYLARRKAARGEFYGLLMLVITGMIGMVVSTDIVAFFVSFELMSLPTYVLAGYLWRDADAGEQHDAEQGVLVERDHAGEAGLRLAGVEVQAVGDADPLADGHGRAGDEPGGRDPGEHGLARHEQVDEEDDESAHGHDHAGQDHDDSVVGAHLEQPPGHVEQLRQPVRLRALQRRRHPLEDLLHRYVDELEERVGIHAHPDDEDDQGHQGEDLAGAQVAQALSGLDVFVAAVVEHDALEHPQQVGGGEDDAGRGDGRQPVRVDEEAEEAEELADEAAQAGQPGRAEDEEEEESGHDGQRPGQHRHVGDLARVRALVQVPDHEEQGAGQQAVAEHDEDGALHARGVAGHRDRREDADRDEPHVAHARVSDELLEVLLDHRDERAVDDGDHRQHHDVGDERHGGVREEGQAEAQHAVPAHLQEHGGEDHGARRGRLNVRVGEPGVQREHRHLDGEGHEEGEEGPELQVVRVDLTAQLLDVEGQPDRRVVLDVVHDHDDGDEHEQAADQREQEELDGRVDAPRAAPDADDEVHRHQHDLPEHVEQEEVGGQKDSAHPHLQQEQRDEEAQLAVLDVVPAADDHDDAEQRGEEEEQGGDAVHTEAVVDVQCLDPGDVLDELHAGRLGVEDDQHDDGEHERGQRDDQ